MPPLKEIIQNSWMASRQEFQFPVKDEDRIKSLRHRWDNCINTVLKVTKTFALSTEYTAQWFDKLVDLHSDTERSYHTLCHLEEVFGFVDLLMLNYEQANYDSSDTITSNFLNFDAYTAIIDLSVFFHDAIYNPKSGTNEEDSAELFDQFVNEVFGDNEAALSAPTKITKKEWSGFKAVKNFIIATKSHILDGAVDMRNEEIPYLQIFLDADMAVLGKSWEAYQYYASLIRQEYKYVPHDLYCEKRAEILQSFIGSVGGDSKTVYLNEHMREALEDRAIANLKREIAILQKGDIPGSIVLTKAKFDC
jgi:predicted metal-dependent HD superfamily phosphohydrolase